MTAESEPTISLEAQVLEALGYGHSLDIPLEPDSPILGRNFLDAYGSSPKRQDVKDLLSGFLDMPKTDADYPAAKAYITRFIEPYYGSPRVD